MQFLPNADDELPGIVPAGRRGWERVAIFCIDLQPFLNDLAELSIDLCLIISVHATAHQAWTRANVTLVLLGPFDNLEIAVTWLHDVASSIAFSTARS
jgi:hypothetical protein